MFKIQSQSNRDCSLEKKIFKFYSRGKKNHFKYLIGDTCYRLSDKFRRGKHYTRRRELETDVSYLVELSQCRIQNVFNADYTVERTVQIRESQNNFFSLQRKSDSTSPNNGKTRFSGTRLNLSSCLSSKKKTRTKLFYQFIQNSK